MAVVAFLNFCLRAIPALTQHIDFEIDTALLTLPFAPDAPLTMKQLQLHLEVKLSEYGTASIDDIEVQSSEVKSRLKTMVAWRTRAFKNVQRTWQRILLRTRGEISLSLRLQDIKGAVATSKYSKGGLLHIFRVQHSS
jgi:hypothetical protein